MVVVVVAVFVAVVVVVVVVVAFVVDRGPTQSNPSLCKRGTGRAAPYARRSK